MTVTAGPKSTAEGGVIVELRNLTLRAGGRLLLQQAAAKFMPGKVTLIIGCSGVGKSLLLRILAGEIGKSHPDVSVSGSVQFDGREVLDSPGRHSVGVVYQSFALFDELSPADNVRFAQAHRQPRPHNSSPAPDSRAFLEELQIPTRVRTAALSGGQQQRLAIARTLAYDPDVILYDEPTSGLDVATATQVACLIRETHATHPKTSILVTHDYESLSTIADEIYLLDPETQSLRRIDREDWPALCDQLKRPTLEEQTAGSTSPLLRWTSWASGSVRDFFETTTRALEAALLVPWRLLPLWKSPIWGMWYFWHYLRLVAGPSAWLYIAIAGAIIGFVTTHFTFRFLPYANYTEPLLVEDLLNSMGFALHRILVPILATVLIAARCGAAVASDVGGKSFGQQMAALRTFGARPERYLLSGILYAFLIGTPLLLAIGFLAAKVSSLLVFTATHPGRGPSFWHLHFHRELIVPGEILYQGSGWLLAKTLLSAAGIASIAYHRGARPKLSSRDVSTGITSAILWSTLFVLVVHFAFSFFEFD